MSFDLLLTEPAKAAAQLWLITKEVIEREVTFRNTADKLGKQDDKKFFGEAMKRNQATLDYIQQFIKDKKLDVEIDFR